MHVLDRRTLLIINKMMSQGLFDRVTGVISTGKEANVFRTEKFTDNGVKFYALKVCCFGFCISVCVCCCRFALLLE